MAPKSESIPPGDNIDGGLRSMIMNFLVPVRTTLFTFAPEMPPRTIHQRCIGRNNMSGKDDVIVRLDDRR